MAPNGTGSESVMSPASGAGTAGAPMGLGCIGGSTMPVFGANISDASLATGSQFHDDQLEYSAIGSGSDGEDHGPGMAPWVVSTLWQGATVHSGDVTDITRNNWARPSR